MISSYTATLIAMLVIGICIGLCIGWLIGRWQMLSLIYSGERKDRDALNVINEQEGNIRESFWKGDYSALDDDYIERTPYHPGVLATMARGPGPYTYVR